MHLDRSECTARHARAAGRADSWHEGGFERAVAAATRAGLIEPLPLGFYRLSGRHTCKQSEGRKR